MMTDLNVKVDNWKNLLLDLGLRNKLLNYRETKRSTLRFKNPDIFSMWNSFVVNENPLVFPLINEDDPEDILSLNGEVTEYAPDGTRKKKTALSRIDPSQIVTNQSAKEQQKTLRNLRTKAKDFMEEQGINALYLSFGFLQWTETMRSDEFHDAPLILVPVTLKWESIMSPFILELHEDEILVNPTLLYKLEHDFGCKLPEFDADASLEDFFTQVERVTAANHWTVLREVSLGMLSFLKISMYQDLEVHREAVLRHPVVRAIAGDNSAVPHDVSDISRFDFDRQIRPEETFQVVDADSSQQEAILCAKKGISFVLQGPPGTGKSQTITNIIAEKLADGKKVLFVSEKMAALDVVYKRLSAAGLADFCLVLHSYKANKKQTLDQLGRVLSLAGKKAAVKEEAFQKLARLTEDRDRLNQYAEQIHTTIEPLHKTIFEANGILSEVLGCEDVIFSLSDVRKTGAQQYNAYINLLDRFSEMLGMQKTDYHVNPWRGATVRSVSNELRHDVQARFKALTQSLERLSAQLDRTQEALSFCIADSRAGAEKLLGILETAKDKVPFLADWILQSNVSSLLREVEQCSETKRQFLRKREEVQAVFRLIEDNDSTVDLQAHTELTDTALLEACKADLDAAVARDQCYRLWQDKDAFDQLEPRCEELETRIREYFELQAQILEEYEKEILDIPFNEIYLRFKTESTGSLKFLNRQYRADKKRLQGLTRGSGKKLTDSDILSVLSKLREMQDRKTWIDAQHDVFTSLCPGFYRDEQTDFARLRKHMTAFRAILRAKDLIDELRPIVEENEHREPQLREHYRQLYDGLDTDWEGVRTSLEWTDRFARQMGDLVPQNERFITQLSADPGFASRCGDCAAGLSDALGETETDYIWFAGLFADGAGMRGGSQHFDEMPLGDLTDRLTACRKNLAALEEWIDYVEIRRQCEEAGLGGYISELEKVKLPKEHIVPVFKKRFFRLWLDSVLPEYPAVANFRRRIHESEAAEFRQLDQDQFQIASSRIQYKLINELPSMDHFTSGVDEISILKRELGKKRKIMPLRRLFAQIPNLILTLKPCLMMSPLSVSMYLESDSYTFDTVIFDEASQVFTENAIGAIFRGKQVIIAGDSKQLPPTSFFTAAGGDSDFDADDDADEAEDMGSFESILDEAALLPERTLLWHYRSRHEQLIAFSNAKIYQNRLITFPSSVDRVPDTGVEYIYVSDGRYDRGGRRGNVIEARRVAETVFDHFRKFPERSLGVIAFGEVQQQAIDTALRKMRQDDPSFESFFNEERSEPFFVKSLENVQGDERDTIIFSIGYGKDLQGVMRMNFGPLSMAGGERRLNVAVTRAKYNVKLVGSIQPTDIDTSRVSSEGPKLLRSYIDYAMRGPEVLLGEITESDVVRTESPFEESVFRFLEEKGYSLATQVGCSGYRIDIAVKHPTLSGRYVLGIECDGATYHSARTARERDRLRQDVLESIGWKIYRIWSTDWIKDPVTEGRRLVSAVENAIADYREVTPQMAPKQTGQRQNGDFLTVVNHPGVETDASNPYQFKDFPRVSFVGIPRKGGYMQPGPCIMRIIEIAGPIHFDDICQLMAPQMGMKKASLQVKQTVTTELSRLRAKYFVQSQFYFPKSCPPNVVDRVPHRLAGSRTIRQISVQELASGMLAVAETCIGPTKEGLISETARAFGFNHKGKNITDALTEAVDVLEKGRYIRVVDGKVLLTKTWT